LTKSSAPSGLNGNLKDRMAGLENRISFGVVRCFAALAANRNGSKLILKAPHLTLTIQLNLTLFYSLCGNRSGFVKRAVVPKNIQYLMIPHNQGVMHYPAFDRYPSVRLYSSPRKWVKLFYVRDL